MPRKITGEKPTWRFDDDVRCDESSGEEYVARPADGAFLDCRFEGTRQAQKKDGKAFLIADVVRENPWPYDADEDGKESLSSQLGIRGTHTKKAEPLIT
jgi:hypothetical protein